MFTIQTERWKAIDAEIEEVAASHWEELALDKMHFERDLDHEQYQKLDDMGMLHIVTVRDGNKLVGYSVWFIMPHHLHYKSSGKVALADMYFLQRNCRNGAGVRMLMEACRGLKERGVIRAHASCKVHEDHTKLFEAMGWALTDLTFSKLLVEAKCP